MSPKKKLDSPQDQPKGLKMHPRLKNQGTTLQKKMLGLSGFWDYIGFIFDFSQHFPNLDPRQNVANKFTIYSQEFCFFPNTTPPPAQIQ
jgi:hypothetical protein